MHKSLSVIPGRLLKVKKSFKKVIFKYVNLKAKRSDLRGFPLPISSWP
jgi:hypothetical protein